MALLADAIGWLSAQWTRRSPRLHWGAYLEVLAATVDVLVEIADEGRKAALPGQVDETIAPNLGGFWSVDALPMIGRDRLIRQGLAEGPAGYASRLRRWRDAWATAGTCFGVLEELAGALSAPGQSAPLMRIVNGAGVWWTREPDGTHRQQRPDGTGFYFSPDGTAGTDTALAHAWDWDSTTQPAPADQGDPTRFWLIIYPPAAGPYLTSTDLTFSDPGVVGDGWNDPHPGYEGSPDEGTIGSNAPIQLVELVRSVVHEWHASGFKCAWVIICFDEAEFTPSGTGTAYPDGSWGQHSKLSGGAKVIARPDFAEYWPAAPGGQAP